MLQAKTNGKVLLSKNALKVLESRYLKRNTFGKVTETPLEMFQRVSKAVAQAELCWGSNTDVKVWEEKFYRMLTALHFLPNSPTLMNAGLSAPQLSACFVLPVEDHLKDIFSSLKLAALVQKSGGGTGFNFSHLRPKNDLLIHTQGQASGPVAFMKIFNTATTYIKQGGKRRGANMGILNIDHPDIEEFICCKRRENAFTNFNISIGIYDHFMNALQVDGDWLLIHPRTGAITKVVKAKHLWNLIIENAWSGGDPGLIFLDTINQFNPTPSLGTIEATNPCGEVPLLPYEACNLGSINVAAFIKQKKFDWPALEQTVILATRFLDNVIEASEFPSLRIKNMVKGNRKIGLGVMGWAEALSKLEIPYDSNHAVETGRTLMRFIAEKSLTASYMLARERGPFTNWQKHASNQHIPVRNATRTCIAPTGTISILANTSSSIEPYFALAYRRQHILEGSTLYESNNTLLEYLKQKHIDPAGVISHIEKTGTLRGMKSIPSSVKALFKTAPEIHPSWHLKHQKAFQEFTDNAVSKTINLPQKAKPSDVHDIYFSAWEMKLKGITIFRLNSRKKQVLDSGIKSDVKSCKVCIE
ncbi:adenosylcobalamin-dependent ribonucleoside-diphosphate reductase [Fulvivirga sp. 29W222]|uniref:Vitamin B12-dependent ribonucleotide reductase n=1 Tax=Fulvivirga marina TaxID=2494733 RepID=A0A937G2F2_9BACT|nr:adenosylcobalamin-dependent ribonucleoside-diphosphate reductase [Fulvivirga marina]MBL6448740.1 adenosylcobalamin-dependent ribonucleoside-diphosphate reductase [Fulvivirga marina]